MTPALVRSSPQAQGMSSGRLERASALLAAEVDARRVAAASMLVARNGQVVLHAGHGAAADAVYLLASIYKRAHPPRQSSARHQRRTDTPRPAPGSAGER